MIVKINSCHFQFGLTDNWVSVVNCTKYKGHFSGATSEVMLLTGNM